jgi:O-6-methylguanine DNA methyltransferase
MTETLRALICEASLNADDTPPAWGWIGLVASEHGLRLLSLPASTHELAQRYVRKHYADVTVVRDDDPFLLDVAAQVQAYFDRRLEKYDVVLDLRGHTHFELSVWAATARIPYGETRTYAWIAGQVGGGPGAAQAAGMALANNPVPLIVPCHRVIGSDGSLHGFAGGLDMKARLLALENRQLSLAF